MVSKLDEKNNQIPMAITFGDLFGEEAKENYKNIEQLL